VATVVLPIDAEQTEPAPRAGLVGGILGAIRSHPTTWLISAIVVAFVGLGTGAVFTGIAVASNVEVPVVIETEEPIAERELPAEVADSVLLRTCSVADQVSDDRLNKVYISATLIDSSDSVELLARRSGTAVRVGSVMKVYTAAAAIAVLGPDYTLKTQVVDGNVPGTIVLVGRGDATLSALPEGSESYYPGAAKLSDLAAQAIAEYQTAHPDVPITQVILDATYWNPADNWDSSWARSEQTTGYQSEVTALQVDGDRADPTKAVSPRGTDPVATAGAAFLSALRAADPGGVLAETVTTSSGSALSGATLLGEVSSQPVSVLIKQMLLDSDNTLAEVLARVVSKNSGLDGSASSLRSAIPSAVGSFGADTSGMVVADGSGLSANNAVSMTQVAEFMALVWEGNDGLSYVRDGLSLAGVTGSLRNRFGGDNADARGNVYGKTGWITTAYSLAGIVEAKDGSLIAYSVSAVRDGISSDAKDAIDSLVAGFYRCGSNLANY